MNLNTILNPIQFSEAKQVGVIYHFAGGLNDLLSILKMGGLFSYHWNYISFTRDYNLKDYENESWGPVRLAFNGDAMSNKYKIEPFHDESNLGISQRSKGRTEAEERVMWTKEKVFPCLNYCIECSIDYNEWHPTNDDDRAKNKTIVDLLATYNIPLNIEEQSWRPVKL